MKTNFVAFSSQANCTDRSTAAGLQILVSNFVDAEVTRGQCSG
jgi:hypothetical protein